jgi:hypothetical protein
MPKRLYAFKNAREQTEFFQSIFAHYPVADHERQMAKVMVNVACTMAASPTQDSWFVDPIGSYLTCKYHVIDFVDVDGHVERKFSEVEIKEAKSNYLANRLYEIRARLASELRLVNLDVRSASRSAFIYYEKLAEAFGDAVAGCQLSEENQIRLWKAVESRQSLVATFEMKLSKTLAEIGRLLDVCQKQQAA